MTELTHDSERFGGPMHDAEQVASRVWRDGVEYVVGDAIAYDVQMQLTRVAPPLLDPQLVDDALATLGPRPFLASKRVPEGAMF